MKDSGASSGATESVTDEVPSGTSQKSEAVQLATTHEGTGEPSGSGSGGAGGSQQHLAGTEDEPKSLTKSQRRNIRRRLKREAASAVSASEEQEEVGGRKRPRSAMSTPSPAEARKKKKTQVSFAKAASVTRLAIVKDKYPSNRLNPTEAFQLQAEILRRSELLPEQEQIPRFSNPMQMEGALIIHCDNAWTVEWLMNTFRNKQFQLGGAAVRVMLASELPKPVKVVFKSKDIVSREPKDILKRLNRGNPKLKSLEWRVLHRDVETHSIRWIFEVGTEAAAEIRAAGYRAYAGLDRGFFRILKDPNVKEKDQGEEAAATASGAAEDSGGEGSTSSGTSSNKASMISSIVADEALAIGDLCLDTGSEGTLQPTSPVTPDDMDMLMEESSEGGTVAPPSMVKDGEGT